ncbi:DUF1127 domain-containing protein [Denitromonas halophila]|uniref:DUF1127 domain-containing protein n=1 Tax=Denitromonas halophila TaxID=1629404 RepID=A0A557R0B9_9RHOO|nr:DUF1127 domain-containing protein [Denitromonas halophila]TVO58598.1 DUF1127 domain-containing protein [Denitromonas halophila]
MSSLTHKACAPAVARTDIASVLRQLGHALRTTITVWRKRSAARRELRELDEHVLRDVGISRSQADFEGRKPFWVK